MYNIIINISTDKDIHEISQRLAGLIQQIIKTRVQVSIDNRRAQGKTQHGFDPRLIEDRAKFSKI